MALCRQMHDLVGFEIVHRTIHRGTITNISLKETIVRFGLNRDQGRQIAGIG